MALLSNLAIPTLSSLAGQAISALSGEIAQLIGSLSLQQSARLIRLEGTPVPVLVERFSGTEGIDQLFRFEVDVIAEIAALAPTDWLAKEVQLVLVDAQGQEHVRHGRVTMMSELGSDGGFSRYRLTLMPWAAWLASRQDCWVFQGKTVLDIATEILGDHDFTTWRQSVTQPLRQRSLCIQYQESDWSFLTRLFAEEGLSYVFEHQDGTTDRDSPASRCCLHVFDGTADLHDAGSLPFGRVAASMADDRLNVFEAHVSSQPRGVARSSWDYRKLQAPAGQHDSTQDAGALEGLEDYDGSGAYGYDDPDHAERQAEQRQQAHDGRAERFRAEGAVRALRPAQRFTLSDHPMLDGAQFAVRAIAHHGANNLQASIKDLLTRSGIESGSYRQALECQSIERPLAPEALAKPTASLQTATVVGAGDGPITSDRDHRIKVQFHWQRGAGANAGSLDHPQGDNAPGDASAGTWVRVAEWLAGPNWGSQFTPRVGDEVLVDFVEGDIDRPLIVGSVHHDGAVPPYSAGHDGPANHAGHLSGYHSQNLGGDGYNRWVMDDTPGELRSQLKSSQLETELNLGHIVAQPAASAWRGAERGQGFELRSDGWGIVRGAAGLLFSSHLQGSARESVLATAATRSLLKGAESLAKQLDDSASTHTALKLKAKDDIANLHTQLVDGGDGPDDITQSAAVLESPASLTASSEASGVVYAGADLHATAASDGHLAAEHTLTLQSGNRLSLFTHHGGLKLIAAEGDLTVGAHGDALHLASEQALTITSTEAEIQIAAQDAITLFGGGAAIELKGGDITFKASGVFTVKGNADWMGATNNAGTLKEPPYDLINLKPQPYSVTWQVHSIIDSKAAPDVPYELYVDGKQSTSGKTDGSGQIPLHLNAKKEESTEVWIGQTHWVAIEHSEAEPVPVDHLFQDDHFLSRESEGN